MADPEMQPNGEMPFDGKRMFRIGLKPPQNMRLPSNGISPFGCISGSAMIFSQA